MSLLDVPSRTYLHCLCLQDNLLPEDRLKVWLAQALLALLCLEEHGVLHRDLKTANLFLNDAEDLLIGDFGLATYRKGDSHEDHSVVGTAPYMSPELISGNPYSFSSDIWCGYMQPCLPRGCL
jgi:serine/threonine protein kinase